MSKQDQVFSILRQIERSALNAAQLILGKFESSSPLVNWRKEDSSLVTEADIEAQHLLVRELQKILPLVGEEDTDSHSIIETHSDYITIDPLDGTTSAKRMRAKTGGEVGYGPIVGLVLDSRLVASVFVNIPQRKALSARLDDGCESFSMAGVDIDRVKLPEIKPVSIDQSAMLFFAGQRGELNDILKLRQTTSLENYYRFGGFANDCMRVALNLEQAQLQYSVKVWDLPAVLMPKSVGARVILDPRGAKIEIENYKPRLENPLLTANDQILPEILSAINQ